MTRKNPSIAQPLFSGLPLPNAAGGNPDEFGDERLAVAVPLAYLGAVQEAAGLVGR
jgi:hypothetical protein